MRAITRLLLCVTLCMLMASSCHGYRRYKQPRPQKKAPSPVEAKTHTCRVTNGSSLTSFLGGKAKIQLPCRYMLAEFVCHKKTQIIVESEFGSDGGTFISAVTVNKSRGMQDGKGGVVQDYDEASIRMEDLKEFLHKGDLDKTHWTSAGDAVYWSGKKKWRLQGRYDPDEGRTVLTDASGEIRVYFSYVDVETDPSTAGNLIIECKSPSYGEVVDSTGYFCGRARKGKGPAYSSKHLKKAAKKVGLRESDYITYQILMEQNIPQTNPMCQEASDLLRDCKSPARKVRQCGMLLDQKQHTRCFVDNDLNPLEAFVHCLRWRCDDEVLSCDTLRLFLDICPGKKKLRREVMAACPKRRGYSW